MFTSLTARQKAAAYYLIAIALALLVAVFGPAQSDGIQILSMFTPAVAVLLMLLVVTRDGHHRAGWAELGLHRAAFRVWPLALVAASAVAAVPYGLVWLLGVASWQVSGDFLIDLVLNIAIISLFAVFEEVGWRGYLLPKLAPVVRRGAAALVGFLHGVWHLPLMLLTTSYNPVGNPIVTVPLFLAVLTGAGILYGNLRDRSAGGIWAVVIAHGTFNAVLGALDQATFTSHPVTVAYLAGETGLITLGTVFLTALILTRVSRPHRRPVGAHLIETA